MSYNNTSQKAFISKNTFLEVLALSYSEESEKNMGSNSKISITTSKLSFKKVSSSKLFVTLFILISKEKASTIS